MHHLRSCFCRYHNYELPKHDYSDKSDIIINNKFIPTATQLAAQLTLSGGGVVSWSGTHLKWGSRLYAAPVSKPELALDGIYYIDCPPGGRVITRYTATGTVSVTVTNDGIPLSAWDALYWFIPSSATLAAGALNNFFIVGIDATNLSAYRA